MFFLWGSEGGEVTRCLCIKPAWFGLTRHWDASLNTCCLWKFGHPCMSLWCYSTSIFLQGRALLHWACDRGHKEMVSLLLQHKAEINIQVSHTFPYFIYSKENVLIVKISFKVKCCQNSITVTMWCENSTSHVSSSESLWSFNIRLQSSCHHHHHRSLFNINYTELLTCNQKAWLANTLWEAY